MSAWYEAKSGAEFASVFELVCVAHCSYRRGCDQSADAFDSGQPLTAFVLAKEALHFEVVLADTLVQELESIRSSRQASRERSCSICLLHPS